MKPVSLVTLFLSITMSASAVAQPPEGRLGREGRPGQEDRPRQPGRSGEGGSGPRGGMMRMPNPLMEAIDADKDGELSPEEIANAVVALKTLDKNEDGKLDSAETRPNFEGMTGGFGGGFGGPGGGFPGGPGGPGGGQGGNPEEMVQRLLAMDENKDGQLSKEEIPERLQSMLTRGDKNEDGSLDKEEIMAVSRERSGGPGGGTGGTGGFGGGPGGPGGFGGGDFVGQMMERADADKDGKLTGDEIPEFMRGRMEQIDTNKDGSLDKAEMEAAGARMRGGRGEGGPGGRGGDGPRRGNRPPVEGESDGGEKKPPEKNEP